MEFPPKVYYKTEEEYRRHFEQMYCRGPIVTFDNIHVYFRKRDFDHCMFESAMRTTIKDTFSRYRAERIDWIKQTLINPDAELYVGWDRSKKRYDKSRRVAVVYEDFVVVISIKRKKESLRKAYFITAFLADKSIKKIRKNPVWNE